MIEARISSVVQGHSRGTVLQERGSRRRDPLPKDDLWDAGRICCGLSQKWSAIGVWSMIYNRD